MRIGFQIRADARAQNESWRAGVVSRAFPCIAVRGRFGADMPAGAAVVGIENQVGAGSIAAVDSAGDAVIKALSGNARDIFIHPWRGTRGAAVSTIEDVTAEI